ncbi:MAG: T9SS type A sorting domain-containing protein [Chitinophagales bacterium]
MTPGKCHSLTETISVDNNTLTIYLNPTTGTFEFSISNFTGENITVTVLNPLGQGIYNQQFSADQFQNAQTISLGDVANGIYIVQILAEEKLAVKRIVVQR